MGVAEVPLGEQSGARVHEGSGSVQLEFSYSYSETLVAAKGLKTFNATEKMNKTTDFCSVV